jgi:hypothetical protein
MRGWSKPLALLLIVAVGPGPAVAAPDIVVFRDTTYAAIAYSESTGAWGYAYDNPSRDIAEILAKRRCRERDPLATDALPVGFVRNGWVALALGENGAWGAGYSHGDGATNTAAKKMALDECLKRSKTARLVICVCSLDRRPELFDEQGRPKVHAEPAGK